MRLKLIFLGIVSAFADPFRRLIIEGERVDHSEYPFIVKFTQKGQTGCTGSLIAPDVVITAAHCVFSSLGNHLLRDSETISLQFGDNSQQRRILSARNRDFLKADEDLALVFLDSPVTIIPGVVETLKIESGSAELPRACHRITVAGFGVSSVGPRALTIPDGRLRDIKNVRVHPDTVCEKSTKLFKSGAHFCFGKDDVRQTCRGDSGGPVVMRDESGEWKLVGLTIYGSDDSCVSGPGYGIRVAPFAPWIEETVRWNSIARSFDKTSIFTQYPIGDMSLTFGVIRPPRRLDWNHVQFTGIPCWKFGDTVDRIFKNQCHSEKLTFDDFLKPIDDAGFQWELHADTLREACKPIVACAAAHSELVERWRETREQPCWGSTDVSHALGVILNPCIEDIPRIAEALSRRSTVKENYARELEEMGLEPCPEDLLSSL